MIESARSSKILKEFVSGTSELKNEICLYQKVLDTIFQKATRPDEIISSNNLRSP